ncbi:two-component system response regulator [Planctobacterium marinum]|uniref:two-component system response regulator n=1 Tax=Planctobacterium marinum TaxID=1631968 RepID=UPI001E4B06B3|nr:EAL domain-containing protein [Planctobacterium marinum]MCC2604175.1 EAL domain-containing protein [Planctobacterium marinum]
MREEDFPDTRDFAKILVVDDDQINLETICHTLEYYGHNVFPVEDGETALMAVFEFQPDLIILDINMPGMNGLEVCKRLQTEPSTSKIPIIFLTGSKTDINKAFELGGVDYIVKPFNTHEVLARVNVHLRNSLLLNTLADTNAALEKITNSLEEKVKERTRELALSNQKLTEEIAERQKLQSKLEHLAKYDMTSSLLNRISMEEHLDFKLLESQMLEDFTLFYLYMDVDQFKVINDTCGHAAGDQLIRNLSALLKRIANNDEIVARMGGDEFSIIYNSPDIESATRRAVEIRKAINDMHFDWEKEHLFVNVSMGLVELNAEFQDANHIMSVAERLYFESKSQGGGELLIYEQEKETVNNNTRAVRWVPVIQQAIEQNKFSLFGQGIYATQKQQSAKFEVLLRMQSSGSELIQPSQFISIAEQYHLISAIDQKVLEKTCQMMADFPNFKGELALNISGESVYKASFVDQAYDTIQRYDIDASKLCFEINESSALTNLNATRRFIEKLKQLGCKFALDDFGTGTSSYGFLRELDVQYVKIDGSFIHKIGSEKISRMMVESIVAIARENNMSVIAEAVETESMLKVLKEIDVDYAQGFLLHKPEALENLIKMPH